MLDGQTIRFAITTSGSGSEQRINGTSALPAGVWKHVAVTLAGSVGILYVDGVEAGRNSSMTLKPSSLGSTNLNYIGRSQYADPYLDGQIDEFRIYDRAISASEVQALANPGLPTPTPTPDVTPTPTPATTPTPPPSNNWAVKPFNLNQVSLQTSTFTGNRDRTYSYLLFLSDDRMLYNFKVTAGLSTNGAAALGGWDAPDCNLRGHSTGHYLSALAQAYASTGNSQYKTKIDYMIAELKKCQDALPSKGYTAGFLAAYPETQFIQLESLATYPTIWAPYYTQHKIIAGLIDCYQLAGNTVALDIAKKNGDWVYNRLSKFTRSKLQQMWGLYIAGEFGGMNEELAELYSITGNPNHLSAATYFDNDKLFTPCSNNQDQLNGLHANQHIPHITGALRVFPSTLNWSSKGFTITQTTGYPTQESTSITVNGSGPLAIKLRVPFWVKNGYTVKINDVTQSIPANPGTYITINRVWASGDKIDISMPFGLMLERTPDNSTIGSFLYGPILLVGKNASTSCINMPANPTLAATGTPLNFTANGITLAPMYSAYNFAYHAYFRIQ